MEKEKEFFGKMRAEQIDTLIKRLNELKDDSFMVAFKDDRELYKKQVDDIFNSWDRYFDYITMKKFFEQN
jgi:hypothetical protein